MTQGSAIKHLISFAFPLLVGNLFQQLYNTVDTWVVGNYVGNEAFSAVGSVGPIINMLIGAFMGLSSGAGVVISQYYGAKRFDKVHDAVHTAIFITAVLSVVISLLGIAITPLTLRMMNTPEEVWPEAQTYLIIYFAGATGLLFYNMASGILRAVGNSQLPFYFLVVSAVLNTILDLLFVIVFRMGVAGVAYATIIAQAVSAFLSVMVLIRSDACIQLKLKDIKCHMDMLKKTVKVGIPASIQMAITAFSNIFVQSYINYFGANCMGGWTAYAKIDQLMFLPMQSLALAATTYVGQNLGKGYIDNAKKGTRTSLLLSLASTAVIGIAVIPLAKPLVSFFNSKPEVIEIGSMFLKYITPFYLLCCFNQIYSGALRGAGDSRSPMIIMLASFVVFRQIYLYVMANFIANEMLPIAMSYPAGWFVCSVSTYIYYKKSGFKKNMLMEPAAK